MRREKESPACGDILLEQGKDVEARAEKHGTDRKGQPRANRETLGRESKSDVTRKKEIN